MSLNDPQWGKRGNSGPPDLDEIWRNVNRKVNELLGRKTGDGGEGGPSGNGFGLPIGGVGLLVALVVLVWLASGFYIVDEGRRGVVTRFGKLKEVTQPGPRWHLPYPIETVELVDFTRVKTVDIGYRTSSRTGLSDSLMLTDDENIIDIKLSVQYWLKSATDYLFNDQKPDETVALVAETAIREVVGRKTMDFALYEGREQIAKQTEQLMQDMLNRYGTGVEVQKVNIQNILPPKEVQAAFDDAVKASQDQERFRNEGQSYANDVVPRARGAASRALEEANGYTASVVQKAEGDASRFKQILSEYKKDPAVMRDRLYLDMMQSVLGNTSKVYVDQKNGNNVLYLPIDKLMPSGTNSGASPTAAPTDAARAGASASTPASEATITLDPARVREGLRSRDRSGDAR